MNLSLMSFQIMRVISSPSSSTIGFSTLILLEEAIVLEVMKNEECGTRGWFRQRIC